jgi:ketosteroid isomerase-like protein
MFHFSYPAAVRSAILSAMENSEKAVLALERAALDRWGKGDPDGYLEITTTDVAYLDPFVHRRVDGIDALRAWYEPIRGKVRIDRDEIIDPRVQVIGDAAILTMQFRSYGSEGAKLWNCTEVYQRTGGDWKIAHSHWSYACDPAIS